MIRTHRIKDIINLSESALIAPRTNAQIHSETLLSKSQSTGKPISPLEAALKTENGENSMTSTLNGIVLKR
jgi:hypothetical protein